MLENEVGGHSCQLCLYEMDVEATDVLDILLELEDSIPMDVKMSLFHIAGYITRKDEELFDTSPLYAAKFGKYTSELDRGLLNIPTDRACQWVFLCYIMFCVIKEKVCRRSLVSIFLEISEQFKFAMKKSHGTALANILFKNLCLAESPRSSKESRSKIIKLAV